MSRVTAVVVQGRACSRAPMITSPAFCRNSGKNTRTIYLSKGARTKVHEGARPSTQILHGINKYRSPMHRCVSPVASTHRSRTMEPGHVDHLARSGSWPESALRTRCCRPAPESESEEVEW